MKRIFLITVLLITCAGAGSALRFVKTLDRLPAPLNQHSDLLADGRPGAARKTSAAPKVSSSHHIHRKKYE